jgi:hypothetical protein
MNEKQQVRIRLVTRRYHELQGLGGCCWGLGMVAGSLVAPHALQSDWGLLWVMLVFAGIAVPGKLLSDRLYKQRFGRVATFDEDGPLTNGLLMGVAFGCAFIVEKDFAGPGYPHPFFLLIGAIAARPLVRDWPLRKYLVVEVAAAVLISVLYVTVPPAALPDNDTFLRESFLWQGFGLLGLALMVTGMLDHRLLVSTLPGLHEPLGQGEHADTL